MDTVDISLETFNLSPVEDESSMMGRVPIFIPYTKEEYERKYYTFTPTSEYPFRRYFVTLEGMLEWIRKTQPRDKWVMYRCCAGFYGVRPSPQGGKYYFWYDEDETPPSIDVFGGYKWTKPYTDNFYMGYPGLKFIPYDWTNDQGTFAGAVGNELIESFVGLNFTKEEQKNLRAYGATSLIFFDAIPLAYDAGIFCMDKKLYMKKLVEFDMQLKIDKDGSYCASHKGISFIFPSDERLRYLDNVEKPLRHSGIPYNMFDGIQNDSVEAIHAYCRYKISEGSDWWKRAYDRFKIASQRAPDLEGNRHDPCDLAAQCAEASIEGMTVEGNEHGSASMEYLSPEEIKDKRTKITDYIVKVMNKLDPSGDNGERYRSMLSQMSDKEFERFMNLLKDKKYQLNIIMPNMVKTFRMSDVLDAADFVGHKLMHRLWLPDPVSNKKFLTNEEHMVLQLPIRRAQQEVDKKLSVPTSDTHIDTLTGQVMGPDKACSISMTEMRSLHTRGGLENTMKELIRVRGGDINAYGDFKRQMEENGEAKLESLNPATKTRSTVIASIYLKAMLLGNNLAEMN